MGKPIRDITIVGGGTAGWLAATMLNHRLQWGFAHPEGVNITLIESPDTPTIGVGEATIPGIRQTLQALEISEAEFVTRTNATFKLGVQFENWHKPGGSKPRTFFHPFTGGVQLAGRNPAASLLAYGVPAEFDLDPQLGNIVGHGVAAAMNHRSPRPLNAPPYQCILGYAYHLDAGLLADFLREVAVARGVTHVKDHVLGVEKNDRGHIGALNLKEGGRREVELVIDCTGFRGLLINDTLGEPFESYADFLPNDRATAIQVAHGENPQFFPGTVSAGMNSGWRWRIPLQSRVGTGYVYSSKFIDEQAATDELIEALDGAERIVEPRTLKMRVGRTRRSWVGNCVAIGLSGGFIEPLESTAIQFIDFACKRLLQCFPSSDFEQTSADKFNAQMQTHYEEVRDFLGLHFTLGDRDDTPYWRAMKSEVKRSDRLEECLAIWRNALPDIYDPRPNDFFSFWSVSAVLFGKGFYDGLPPSGSDLMPEDVWRDYLQEVVDVRSKLIGPLPDHKAALAAMTRNSVAGDSARRAPMAHKRVTLGVALGPSIQVMTPDRTMADARTG